jgi:excisionase family DNA binding protein
VSSIQEFHKYRAKRYVTKEELAEYLQVNPRTIELWIQVGIIWPDKVGPKLVRFDLEKIDMWMAAQNRLQPRSRDS